MEIKSLRIDRSTLNAYHNSLLLPQEPSPAKEVQVQGKQSNIKRAVDSYSGNAASASVIDAEYIEDSTNSAAGPKTVQGPRQPNTHMIAAGLNSELSGETAVKRLPAAYDRPLAADIPLPGTYLDIFA